MKLLVALAVPAVLLMQAQAGAGEVDVVDARAQRSGDGTYSFLVTLRHADTGWEHYADRWDVLAPDGTMLGSRELLHPHVDEQPFTRSLGGVAVPGDVDWVQIRPHDKVHGEGELFRLSLPGR